MERRLAAILAADVVGYSRLIGADEAGTLAGLRSLRKEVVEPILKRHHGRVVKLMGDGLLAEFASVVDAVTAAIEIQEATPGRTAHLPEDRRIALRIGVNTGDVAVEDGDLFGDGVNIAARLQEVADPNGVAISEGAHRELSGRLDLPFEDVGEKALKNIKQTVRIWLWSPLNRTKGISGSNEPSALPRKPSIAVLPFDNLSRDQQHEYLADGMTEDVITGLSRFRSLFVIARNSTFSYKGQSPDVRAVARDLGVRYILEGSVRQGGNRIRITGQLIDAETSNHIRAERYDRDLDDIFVVQDEVTDAIVAAIAPEIDQMERGLAQRKPPDSLGVWGLYQRGLTAYHATTQESLKLAIELFDKANELDPGFAPAFAMAADARVRLVVHYPTDSESILNQAREKARLGTTLDARDSNCLWSDAKVHSYLGHHDFAILKGEEAVALNPSSAMAEQALGFVLGRAGRSEDAMAHIERAMQLSPRDIFFAGFLTLRAANLFFTTRYREALEWAQRAARSPNPRPGAFSIAVAAAIKLGREEEAAVALTDLLAHAPASSLSEIRKWWDWNFPRAVEANGLLIEALREAGLQE
jgi:adenylate cyclase